MLHHPLVKPMYPKVKVRDFEEDGQQHHHDHHDGHGHGHGVDRQKHGHRRYHVASLKDVQSLFAEVSCAPPHHSVKRRHDLSAPVVAKVFIPKVSTSVTSNKHEEIDHCGQENKRTYHDARQNEDSNHDIHMCKDIDDNRANSSARPRAVLSSPANDMLIGKKNRTKTRLPLPSRHHESVKNRHAEAQCRVFIGRVVDESPDRSRENETFSNRDIDSNSKRSTKPRIKKPSNGEFVL